MSDFNENNLIVQSNKLIQQTAWNLDTVPLKVFKILVSCIDTEKPSKIIKIEKNELARLLKTKDNYTHLRQQVKSLQKQVVTMKENDRTIDLVLLPKIVYEHDTEIVECHFSEDLMPFLVHLKKQFTKYPVYNLTAFDSKYGLILYEYLLSEFYKGYQSYKISIEQLKNMTSTTKKYERFQNFKTRVLDVAIHDINNSALEFLVSYQFIKKGRSYTDIVFFIRDRKSALENDFEIVKGQTTLFDEDNNIIF